MARLERTAAAAAAEERGATLYPALLLIVALQAKFGVPRPGRPLLASRGERLVIATC